MKYVPVGVLVIQFSNPNTPGKWTCGKTDITLTNNGAILSDDNP